MGMNKRPALLKQSGWRQGLLFLASLAAMLLAYGMFLRVHYSLDSYSALMATNRELTRQHIVQSRYLTAAICMLMDRLGVNVAREMIPGTALLIVTMALCHTRLTLTVERILREKGRRLSVWVILLVTACSFINVFTLEWYLYPEYTLYYSVCLVTAMEAALLLARGRKRLHYLAAILLVQASLFSYQAALAMFLIWSLVLTLLQHDFAWTKHTSLDMAGSIVTAALPCGVMLIVQKLVDAGGARDAVLNLEHILGNIGKIWAAQEVLWYDQRKFWPDGVLPVLCGVLLAVLLVTLVRLRQGRKIALLLLTLIACLLMPFVPHAITDSFWLAQRTIVGLWSFLSAAALLLAVLNHDRCVLRALPVLTAAVMLLIHAWMIPQIGQEHFRVNDMDRQYMLAIQAEIEAYEAESGVEVTRVAVCKDASFTYAYEGVRFWGHDTNKRCVAVTWGDVTALNFFTGEKYKRVQMDEGVRQTCFAGKNWSSFVPGEQLVFQGDTLNLCLH